MPDQKLTALTDVVTPAAGDWLYIVDISDTTDSAAGSSKKATVAELLALVPPPPPPPPSGITIGSTTITSGTAGRILLESGTNKVTESANLSLSGTTLTVATGGIDGLAINGGWPCTLTAANSGGYVTVGTSILAAGPGNQARIIGANSSTLYGISLEQAGNSSNYGHVVLIASPEAASRPLTLRGFTSRTSSLLQLQTVAGDSLGNVSGGFVADAFADVSTTHTDGTFDTLKTTTLVANALIVNGDKIFFDYALTTVSSATAARRFKLTFAGITLFDSTALTFGAGTGTVRIFGYIIRATSTTCRAIVTFDPTGSATILGFNSNTYVPEGTLTGLTLTGTNNLVLSAAASGTGAASADIVLVQGAVNLGGFGS